MVILEGQELTRHVSGESVLRVFSVLLALTARSAGDFENRFSASDVADFLSGKTNSFSSIRQICSTQDAERHAELAQAVAYLRAHAFLTDEQKRDFQTASSKLDASWQIFCEKLSAVFEKKIVIQKHNLHLIDATLLSQLEWIHDVGFERSSIAERLEMLPESPLFYLNLGKGY